MLPCALPTAAQASPRHSPLQRVAKVQTETNTARQAAISSPCSQGASPSARNTLLYPHHPAGGRPQGRRVRPQGSLHGRFGRTDPLSERAAKSNPRSNVCCKAHGRHPSRETGPSTDRPMETSLWHGSRAGPEHQGKARSPLSCTLWSPALSTMHAQGGQ